MEQIEKVLKCWRLLFEKKIMNFAFDSIYLQENAEYSLRKYVGTGLHSMRITLSWSTFNLFLVSICSVQPQFLICLGHFTCLSLWALESDRSCLKSQPHHLPAIESWGNFSLSLSMSSSVNGENDKHGSWGVVRIQCGDICQGLRAVADT